jgi:two-component system CheB/CheR fusion protein
MSSETSRAGDPGPRGAPATDNGAGAPEDQRAFERVLEFLKESRGFDFTGYKRPSLVRRVRHRMRARQVGSYAEYQDILQLDPAEFTALFNTMLINVTSFFRDPESWTVLGRSILPDLLDSAGDGPIRIWSAGCSAGQEAYSVAMLLHDLMGSSFRERVKIYATDVDEEALGHARRATYSEREIQGVPETFRERYFDHSQGQYAFTPDLRRSVIFGRSDLTRDAPISRIDLLLCRNTLMYFNAETQARVVARFAFALRRNGLLFLGKAETLLNHSAVFDQVDLQRRFFRRARADVVEVAGPAADRRPAGGTPLSASAATLGNELALNNPVAQIVVGSDGRLGLVNHRADDVLGLSESDLGRPFQDLEVSYRPVELRSHLSDVVERRSPVMLREVEWRAAEPDPAYVDIRLMPLIDAAGTVLGVSITFTDVTGFRELRVKVERANLQLESAYEELQSTNEELETTIEELQSTVEELETTNEELQSTNEELETMNEELQSTNDEMQSTHEELRRRTVDITELNAFTQSVLGSLDAAVIVLDRDLIVRVWTMQAHQLWGLRAAETVGQHLLNLDSGLPTAELQPWLRAVVTGQEQAVVGRRVHAVNRRGRQVNLRIDVTALSVGAGRPTGALVVMETLADPASATEGAR